MRKLLGAALLGLAGTAAAEAPPQRPLLLELFTSQGCSSCPPAEAFLRELSTRDDVLPLAFHVDYWNELGWTDPFSAAAFTARQASSRVIGRPLRVKNTCDDLVAPGRRDRAPAIQVSSASRAREPRGTIRVFEPLPVRRKTRRLGSISFVRRPTASLTRAPQA